MIEKLVQLWKTKRLKGILFHRLHDFLHKAVEIELCAPYVYNFGENIIKNFLVKMTWSLGTMFGHYSVTNKLSYYISLLYTVLISLLLLCSQTDIGCQAARTVIPLPAGEKKTNDFLVSFLKC